MKKLLLIASLSITTLSFAQEYSRAKILTDSRGLQELAEMGIAVDHGTVKRETYFVSDFSAQEIQQIRDAGYSVEILISDVKAYYKQRNLTQTEPSRNADCSGQPGGPSTFDPAVPSNFNLGSMAGFYTYQEFLDEIDAMANLYPNLITPRAPISTFLTHENRPIYFLRMSDNAGTDESEPEVLYTAIHHAREPNSLSEVIFFMWYLLENYNSSEEIQYLLDNTELYFVPMINPDGYIYNETTDPNGGGMWRKNRRNLGSGNYGVDLNRNYSYQWGTTGISMNPSAETYPGTGSFTEPETQAIKWLCENRDFVYAMNAHTYADDLLHPIGTTDAEFAVDHDYFQAYTGHMAEYNGYANLKSSDLYPASGDSDDYMYKVDTVIKPKIFSMTPEVGSDADGFWPASADITDICKEMVWPNLIMAHLPHKYLVVKDLDPSTVETMTGNFNHSAYRLGLENGAITVSIEPLEGILSVGSASNHDLAIMATENGAISYTLDPAIQYGDPIRYILKTEYGLWTKRDTIVKTYGSMTSQFLDDASTVINWTGNWSTTSNDYVSPTKSFTDSPTGDYNNNITRTYTFNQTIDLSHVTEAGVRYYAKWEIEQDYDYCQFQVSLDGGTSWIGQCGHYTSTATGSDGVQPVGEPVYQAAQSSWVLEEINLSDYIGESSVQFRFVLQSDGGVRMDGFYFDDFEIMYNVDYTGLEEQTTGIHTMPNPANTSAQIAFDQPVANGTVSVYAMTGERIFEGSIKELTNKYSLNTTNWGEGTYMVIVSDTEQYIAPSKLVIVH